MGKQGTDGPCSFLMTKIRNLSTLLYDTDLEYSEIYEQ